MYCSTHPKRDAVAKCDKCGKPICQNCYDDFDLSDDEENYHLCSECYKEEWRKEAAEAKSLKGMVIREFVFIIIGIIVGLVFGLDICFGWGIISDEPTMMVIAPIYLPFIFGSLLTIIKKIKNSYVDSRDDSGEEGSGTSNFISLIFIVLINLLIAPITTIVRFCQRIGDMRKLNQIYAQDINMVATIDDYVARSLQVAISDVVSGEAGADVEISLDAILAAGGGSESALCDNGEILRTVRVR